MLMIRYLGGSMFAGSSLSWVFGKIFHSGFKYRDRASIIVDIVDSVNGDPRGKTKTSIMRSANLSLDQTNKYIDLLMVCDMLRATDPISSQEVARYKLTEKGLKFAREFDMWRYILQRAYTKII
jgi:predicted transcriptional regulator